MARVAKSLTTRLAWASIRAACRLTVRRIDLHVEGLEHLPGTGPAVLAARHFHHVYDGAALIAVVSRPLRIVVTLDWLDNTIGRRFMTLACRAAGWPVVPRGGGWPRAESATVPHQHQENRRQLAAATRDCVNLLRAGELLLVFPEGYPNVDPRATPKIGDDAFLPFLPGFLRFAAQAERDGLTRVQIIPVGLDYGRGDRWKLTIRFGRPVTVSTEETLSEQIRAIESQVRNLSGLSSPPRPKSALERRGPVTTVHPR